MTVVLPAWAFSGMDFNISSAAAFSIGTSFLRAPSHRIRISIPPFPYPAAKISFPIAESTHSIDVSSFASGWIRNAQLAMFRLPQYVHSLMSFVMADDLEYTTRVASVAYVLGGVLGRRAVTRSREIALCRRAPGNFP